MKVLLFDPIFIDHCSLTCNKYSNNLKDLDLLVIRIPIIVRVVMNMAWNIAMMKVSRMSVPGVWCVLDTGLPGPVTGH